MLKMIKSVKGIFSCILVICLLLNSNLYVLGNHMYMSIEEQVLPYVQDVRDNNEEFGLDYEAFESLYLGNPIYSYEYLETEVLQQKDYLLYPIFSQSELVLWAIYHLENETIEISQELVREMKDFVNTNYNQGASPSDIQRALNKKYGILYEEVEMNEPPSEGIIHQNISNGYPMFGLWEGPSGYYEHVTVIRGLNTKTSTFKIYIMDPAYGSRLVPKSSGNYSYTNTTSGRTYTLFDYIAYKDFDSYS